MKIAYENFFEKVSPRDLERLPSSFTIAPTILKDQIDSVFGIPGTGELCASLIEVSRSLQASSQGAEEIQDLKIDPGFLKGVERTQRRYDALKSQLPSDFDVDEFLSAYATACK